jgi:hypothetical protein
MRKIFITSCLAILLTFGTKTVTDNSYLKSYVEIENPISFFKSINPKISGIRSIDMDQLCQKNIFYARSGCCSWHKGVCGCQFGRAVCCDGTLSPSCGC